MSRPAVLLLLTLVVFTACEGEPTGPENICNAVALPLSGSATAPSIVAIGLEVQASGIIVVATATDPQGTDNLLDVLQSVGVFPDAGCNGTPIVVRDNLSGSGVEETFGTAVDATVDAALYQDISSAQTWPVEVDFQDRDGNRTMGRVLAPILE